MRELQSRDQTADVVASRKSPQTKFKIMSAEPGRKAPYSEDIRWRVVWQKIGMECTFRQISRNLSISIGTAYNHFQLFKDTGDVHALSCRTRRSTSRVVTNHEELIIVGLLLDDPSLYLREVNQKLKQSTGIDVSSSTICRIIHKNGFSRKKMKQIALQRTVECRGKFIADAMFYNVNNFVWVDEMGTDRRDQARKFGYSLKGEPPVCHRILHRGKRISAIAAMSIKGLLTYELYSDTINGEMFLEFIQALLVPEMQPFDGQSSHSILVMDNCSIHHDYL